MVTALKNYMLGLYRQLGMQCPTAHALIRYNQTEVTKVG